MGCIYWFFEDLTNVLPILTMAAYYCGIGLCFIHEWNKTRISNKIEINGVEV